MMVPVSNPLRAVALAVVGVLAFGSCGGEVSTTAGAGGASPSGALTEPAVSADELFAAIDTAVAEETSVRQEMGNLNPPPAVVLEQEYGDGRDALALTVDLGPQSEPMQVYRVDGLVHVEGQEPIPASEIDPDDTALIAVVMHSDVREDFRRMAEIADALSYVGEEDVAGVATHHYRVTLTLEPGRNPGTLPASLRGPKPADLWIGADGLPVRVEVTYSEPLNDIPGTGVSRTDYSAWSESLDLDPADLGGS